MTCPVIEAPVKHVTPTKEEYKQKLFFDALMADAAKALERIPAPEIGKLGNSKIHARGTKAITLVYSGIAWHDCFPTEGCGKCYAMRFRYLHALAHRKGRAWLYSYMSREAIPQLEYIINSEIARELIRANMLRIRLAVRIHEAGDFISPDHVAMWHRIAKNNPSVVFWGYTRSDKVSDAMRNAIVSFSQNDNVHMRASFDPVRNSAIVGLDKKTVHIEQKTRNGMPGAIVVGTKFKGVLKGPAKVEGTINCPEQITHGAISCADCGLCWHASKPVIRFYEH